MIESDARRADPAPAPEPWPRVIWNHPLTRIVACTCVLLLIVILASAALDPALPFIRRLPDHAGEAVGATMEAGSVLLAVWIMARFAEGRRMHDIGFGWRGIVTDTMIGAIIGMAAMSCVIGILGLIGDYRLIRIQTGFSAWQPLIVFLMVGIAEETYFRGFIFRVIEYRYGSLIAITVSSLYFGMLHTFNASPVGTPLAEKIVGPLFISFEAGILLSAAYMATRRLWMAIGIHWAWNLFEGPIYGTNVSGTTSGTLVKAVVKGPFLVSGGSFGPEASIVCLIVCTLAGLMLLRVAIRAGQWKPVGEWQPATAPRQTHERQTE